MSGMGILALAKFLPRQRPLTGLAIDRTKTSEPTLPPDFIARAGVLLNLDIPEDCHPGIIANLDLLRDHAGIVATALKAPRS